MPINFEQEKTKKKDAGKQPLPPVGNAANATGYEAELRRRIAAHPNTATPDELLYLQSINDRINGTVFHQGRMDRYIKIKEAAERYAARNQSKTEPFLVVLEKPDPRRYYANVHLITANPYGRNVEELMPLIEITKEADQFTVGLDDEQIALDFVWTVNDIWTEN